MVENNNGNGAKKEQKENGVDNAPVQARPALALPFKRTSSVLPGRLDAHASTARRKPSLRALRGRTRRHTDRKLTSGPAVPRNRASGSLARPA